MVNMLFSSKAKVVEDIVEFMETLLDCLGYAVEFASTGYDYEVVPGGVSLSLGFSAGASQALEDLLSNRAPSLTISLDFGFAIGITKKLAWVGTGLGGSLTCDSGAGCSSYLTVAILTVVNLPQPATVGFCPIGYTALGGAATCAQSFGGGISAMCCDMNLQTGSNDCR